MRPCPSCNEKTISTKWLLINKSEGEVKHCFECSKCNTKIRKHKNIVLDFISADIVTLGIVTLVLAQVLTKYAFSFFTGLLMWVLIFTTIHFGAEYFAKLKEADENYCLNGFSKKGAILGLLGIVIIVCMSVYCLLLQPLLFNEAPCS